MQLRENVQTTRVNYEAMNAQLLEDLPQLYSLSLSIVTDCLCHLLNLLTSFHADASNSILGLNRVGLFP